MKKKLNLFTTATESDEPELRRVLRENPMEGLMDLSFEREPYFFKASQVEGDNHVTILTRNDDEKVVAMGSRSSRPYWYSGEIAQVGYFSQMRLAKEFRSAPHRLVPGWEKIYQIHKEVNDTKFYLVSILEDNHKAIKLITSGRKGLPLHKEWSSLNTFILPLIKRKVDSQPYRIRKATEEDRSLIISLLQDTYRTKSIAPYWTEESLFRSDLNMSPENFYIAFNATNHQEPIGCLAVWDQRDYKQVYVKGYDPKIKMIRPLLNLFRRWTKYPYFPKIGSSFSHAYLSHIAIAPEHEEVLVPLVQTAINDNLKKGFHYFSLGLLAGTKLSQVIQRKFKPYTLKSKLYWAFWPEDERDLPELPASQAHIEVSIL